MKVNFFGGHDVQNSLNLSDNQCINLYPVTNDSGSVTGFYGVPGLINRGSPDNDKVCTGFYKASNGRGFNVAGDKLYEFVFEGDPDGGNLVFTDRGTLTPGVVTRMTDNGIDMIIVNGIDGWLFNFATNTLKKISVKQADFTVTIASPAVFTSVAHGLIAGDRIDLSSTGLLPTGLDTDTTVYVIPTGLSADSFRVSLTEGGTAINTSGTQSGVHTFTTIGYGFPEGCKTISYINGRAVACEPGTQNFYCSEVLDFYTWDVLNVQTVDSNPDNVVGEIVSHDELIVFCESSGEIFVDTRRIPSPFERNGSGIFECGCASAYSIAKIDNTVFWLGKNSFGEGIVYRLNGNTPQRISTYTIENEMSKMPDISDAKAFVYQQYGHHFYVINFTKANKTYCYDINTGFWHERANLRKGVYRRWEADEHIYWEGRHLVSDYEESSIYQMSNEWYALGEIQVPLKWVRSFTVPTQNMDRVRHSKLIVDCEVGVGYAEFTNIQESDNPKITLRYSDDGGHTWTAGRDKSLGKVGEYKTRVEWNRLGITSGQPRIYELSGSGFAKIVLLNVYVE